VEPGVSLTLTGVAWRDGGDPLTLFIPPGQSVALHSAPASDASDVLDIIAGISRPRSGEVAVDEMRVDQLSGPALERYLAGRGLVSARFPVELSLPALDYVLSGAPDGTTMPEAQRLLDVTGVTDVISAVGTLPAVEQWRVVFARALRGHPRLVLAEDPTPVLDSRSSTAILDLLTDVHAQFGFTLLLTIGRLAMASHCQRLVRLVGGSVVEDELIGDDPQVRGRVDRID
jgi:putative ABC transport system ATP-binding protein